MFSSRIPALLLAAISLLAAAGARGAIGLEPIADQDVPSGKTLVVPLVATDPTGPPRSYTFKIGTPTTNGAPTTTAGIMATVRSGDPHLILGVSYMTGSNGAQETSSNGVKMTGTMEFQLLREFSPIATTTIAGLTQGGFYGPTKSGTTTKYITFHRVVPGYVIQGGDPNGDGSGGPGFTFQDEFSSALIFSGTAGQLAMANSNSPATGDYADASPTNGDTDGSQFFITLVTDRTDLDYGYTIFGQMLRGFSNLTGIANTLLELNGTTSNSTVSKPVNPVNITSATVNHNDADAVLLISATGVCDAPITVTATSGTKSVSQTFTVHAIADTISDPPFAAPLPDITSTNSTANVPVTATDLQLDLIRYGYEQFEPPAYPFVSYGADPTLSLALTSNTDNFFGAEVDSWAGSGRGYEGRSFNVAAGANPLAGYTESVPRGTFGKLNLVAFPAAIFSSGNPSDTAASFTATVNWGDGTLLSGTNLHIVPNGSSGFKVIANHEYKHPGEFPVLVNIADTAGARLALTGTAIIGPSAIGIAAPNINHMGAHLTNVEVANFKDIGAANGKYAATINWGDGHVTAGAISGTNPDFHVIGTHNYTDSQAYTIGTTVTRTGTGGYSASAWSTAHITGVTPIPQVLPPFPQAHIVQIWNNGATGTISNSNPVQYYLSGSVTFYNSGNLPSTSGSFSAYAAPDGTADGTAQIMNVEGYTSFPVQALGPGESFTFNFVVQQYGDARLVLPAGYVPTSSNTNGCPAIGVVTYSDPVGDFDGSQKTITVTNFTNSQ